MKRSIFQTFWKPDCCPDFLFFELENSNLGYLLIIYFLKLCKVSERLDKFDIRHFIRVSPLMFFVFVIYQNSKWGTIVKCLISSLFNLAQTLHTLATLKINKCSKFEVSNSKNKKSGQLSGFQKVWKILLSYNLIKKIKNYTFM